MCGAVRRCILTATYVVRHLDLTKNNQPKGCPPPAQIPAFCKDTSFITTHQHSPNDQVQFITPTYAATIAQVIAGVAGNLARAPGSPRNFTANGNSVQGVLIRFHEPQGGHVDHFVVAARSVSENFYRQRVTIPNPGQQRLISAQTLGLNPGDSFFLSVASVDKQGHESLFAYPEIRCDSSSCVTPPHARNVRAPMLPAGKDPDDD